MADFTPRGVIDALKAVFLPWKGLEESLLEKNEQTASDIRDVLTHIADMKAKIELLDSHIITLIALLKEKK